MIYMIRVNPTTWVVCRKLTLFVSFLPPEERAILHESVHDEILEDRDVSS
jgi:hypothetical protein